MQLCTAGGVRGGCARRRRLRRAGRERRLSTPRSNWRVEAAPRNLAADKAHAYAIVANGTVWSSADGGLTWSSVVMTFSGTAPQFGWPRYFGRLFVFGDDQVHAAGDREFVASSDGGRTWSLAGLSRRVTALARLRGRWYASTFDGVFRSDDLVRWTECSNGLERVGALHSLAATHEGELVTIQAGRTFTSQDECQSWWPIEMRVSTQRADGYYKTPQLFSDSVLGTVQYGDGLLQWAAPTREWVIRTKTAFITALVRDDRGRYWLGTREGVKRLLIDGPEWSVVSGGLDGPVGALAFDPSGYLIAAIDGYRLFRTRLR